MSGAIANQQAAVDQAVTTLRDGQLVLIPTETVYGVAARADDDQAVARLREGAAAGTSAFSLHLATVQDAVDLLHEHPPIARRAAERLLPGPVSLIVPCDAPQSAAIARRLGARSEQLNHLIHDGVLTLRVPSVDVTRELIQRVQAPVIARAARSGRAGPAIRAEQAAAGEGLEALMDVGQTRYAQPSTLVRVTDPGVTVERSGVYDVRIVSNRMRRMVLMVCTGNTCRSPMAEALARHMTAESKNVPADALTDQGVEFRSAGVYAGPGSPASEQAVQAMADRGIDLSGHRSTPLSPELVQQAEVIYTMTRSHREAVLGVLPSAADKTYTLTTDTDIADPFGGDLALYATTADQIASGLEHRLKELDL